jgi:dolichol-phosphate mannosyltransferase
MTPCSPVIDQSSGEGSWSATEKASAAIILGLIFLRLAFLAFPDLFPEEAYYWLYAKHLDIGYLDHPPMVAWLIAGFTGLFGDQEFAIRFGAFLCSLVTSFWVFRLTRFLYDKRTAVIAVLLAQVLPFFFMTGFMMTPDAPLTACWAGMLYYLARVLIGATPAPGSALVSASA